MKSQIVKVPGGLVIQADLNEWLKFPKFHCAILDPDYGPGIIKASWSVETTLTLCAQLTSLALALQESAVPGAHFWLWGGIGIPHERVLYRTLLAIEAATKWQMAEMITWEKKRAFGTSWRCLMNREECLRFVLGDIRKPHFYEKQFTEELRGYSGFNSKHPAKSEFKRLTMIWRHASDMTKKLHQCYKPRPLAESQIKACTRKGDVVLDLFSGSGEVSVVARELGRKFVAYESDPTTFKKLVKRLQST